jgi:23S rRNA (uracil1939-C5)-methyltransferase
VPFALPGETIEAEVEGSRGTLIALQNISAARVQPPCPHFRSCGGCSIQHLDERAYRDWKRTLLVSALMNQGLAPPVRPLRDAAGAGRRRVTLHARLTAAGRPAVGFMAARTHHLVEIETCLVLAPALQAALPAGLAIAALLTPTSPAFDMQFTAVSNGLDCDIRGIPRGRALILEPLAALAARFGICRISLQGEPVITLAEPVITCHGTHIALPPGAFLQATAAGEEALAEFVLAHFGRTARAADLFCGAGTFALRLAAKAPVLAADCDRAALDALTKAWRSRQGLKPVTAVPRDLLRQPLTSLELEDLDFIVFDPPRRGAEAQSRELAASHCRTVLAVSCDPLTFARDAAILVHGGFELVDVLPVDQFQWSAHLEIAACFRRASRPRRAHPRKAEKPSEQAR